MGLCQPNENPNNGKIHLDSRWPKTAQMRSPPHHVSRREINEGQLWYYRGHLIIPGGVASASARKSIVYGECRKLTDNNYLRQMYVVYEQWPNSDCVCCELFGGPQTDSESSTMNVCELFTKISGNLHIAFVSGHKKALRVGESPWQTCCYYQHYLHGWVSMSHSCDQMLLHFY